MRLSIENLRKIIKEQIEKRIKLTEQARSILEKLSPEQINKTLKNNIRKQFQIIHVYREVLKDFDIRNFGKEEKQQFGNLYKLFVKYNTLPFFNEVIGVDKNTLKKSIILFNLLKDPGKHNVMSINSAVQVANEAINKLIEAAKQKYDSIQENISVADLSNNSCRIIVENDNLPFLTRDAARMEKRRKKDLKIAKAKEKKEPLREDEQKQIRNQIIKLRKIAKKYQELSAKRYEQGRGEASLSAKNIVRQSLEKAAQLAKSIGLHPNWPEIQEKKNRG